MISKKMLKKLERIELNPVDYPCKSCVVRITCNDNQKIHNLLFSHFPQLNRFDNFVDKDDNSVSLIICYSSGEEFLECPYLMHYLSYKNLLRLKEKPNTHTNFVYQSQAIEFCINQYLKYKQYDLEAELNQAKSELVNNNQSSSESKTDDNTPS
jgi:hypothetical protein